MSPTKSPTHHIVCPDDLWDRLQTIATARDESASQIVRRLIRDFVADHDTKGSDR